MSEFTPSGGPAPDPQAGRSPFRPSTVVPVSLATIGDALGVAVPGASADVAVTGISLNSRAVEAGDLYVALPGATRHGADFVSQAIDAGAAAVLTDDAGARLLALAADTPVPVLVVHHPRNVVGPLSAHDLRQPAGTDGTAPELFGVTGTNGKTTTTYFITSLLRALGRTTGLIGTIEIVAGGEPDPQPAHHPGIHRRARPAGTHARAGP